MNRKMKHDYQCNAAMGLFKTLKAVGAQCNTRNGSRDVAERIVHNLPSLPSLPRL